MGLESIEGKVKVKGIIVTTLDIVKDCKFEIINVKKYMGIRQVIIDTEVDSVDLLDLMNKYPRAFYALSFSSGMFELKSKAKPPKSGKPGTKEEEPKADFCSVKTNNEELVRDLLFDASDFSEIQIKHEIEIKQIEIPQGVSDPVKMRELAKRNGVLRRLSIIDGGKKVSESEFSV